MQNRSYGNLRRLICGNVRIFGGFDLGMWLLRIYASIETATTSPTGTGGCSTFTRAVTVAAGQHLRYITSSATYQFSP